MKNQKPKKILILGVTASGKGRLAFELAKTLGAEIISVDSMKVYRRMNIGTAKPPKEARRQISYHIIDVVEPSDYFSAGAFLKLANRSIEQIEKHNKSIIAVGGTALYIKALLYGLFESPGSNEHIRSQLRQRAQNEGLGHLYAELKSVDPQGAQNISPNDSKRIIRALEVYEISGKTISSLQKQWTLHPVHDWTIVGLRREKDEETKRINARVKKMIEVGLIEEVKSLLAESKPLSTQARCAIGYAETIDYLAGKICFEAAVELIKRNSRRLAKNQRTWFKAFKNVNWVDIEPAESAETTLARTKTLLHIA